MMNLKSWQVEICKRAKTFMKQSLKYQGVSHATTPSWRSRPSLQASRGFRPFQEFYGGLAQFFYFDLLSAAKGFGEVGGTAVREQRISRRQCRRLEECFGLGFGSKVPSVCCFWEMCADYGLEASGSKSCLDVKACIDSFVFRVCGVEKGGV